MAHIPGYKTLAVTFEITTTEVKTQPLPEGATKELALFVAQHAQLPHQDAKRVKVMWGDEDITPKDERPDEVKPRYYNVYLLTREYGGPEEGGWWYDKYEFLASAALDCERYQSARDLERVRKMFESNYPPEGYVHRIEFAIAATETKERPHYE